MSQLSIGLSKTAQAVRVPLYAWGRSPGDQHAGFENVTADRAFATKNGASPRAVFRSAQPFTRPKRYGRWRTACMEPFDRRAV
jgi:hypothetical protein